MRKTINRQTRGFYMRADEALLIADQLIQGVHAVAVAYKIQKPRGKVHR